MKNSINTIFNNPFTAIDKANFIRDNEISYEVLPDFFGGCFCKVMVTDSRYINEVVFVASASLRN